MHRDIKVVLEFQRCIIAIMNKPNNIIVIYTLSCRGLDYVTVKLLILKCSCPFVVN